MRSLKALLVVSFVIFGGMAAWAQLEPVGRIVGTVTDPSGAVVPGAEVKATHTATGATFTAQTAADGGYVIPSLRSGTYRLEVTMQGFRRAVVAEVAVEVGRASTVNVSLVVGEVAETVEVIAGTEVLQTSETTITSVIKGRQILELPLTSRDALDLALLMPGVTTPGRPRSSSIFGLPKGAVNITIDGINVQDNLLKTSDGFFTIIRPRIDSIEEFSVSTANPGAEAAGEGAVQMRMVSKSGSNEYHGSLFWYHRNPATNAAPWFDNAFAITPQRQLLNQFGGAVGGPIKKDKLFFYFAHDEFRLPQSVSRTRSLLTAEALSGVFRYVGTDTVTRTVDLYALAAADPCAADPVAPCASTPDPFFFANVLPLLNAARGVSQVIPTSPRTDDIRFSNNADSTRRFPDVRFDWNISTKHNWMGRVNYNYFASSPDTLNGQDPTFPGFPIQGGQFSNRRFGVTALRSNFTPTLTNEFRIGFQSSSVSFFGDKDLSRYPTVAGLGVVRPVFNIMSQPFLDPAQSWRNTPATQMYDNAAWVRGTHSLKFGWAYTHVYGYITDTDFFGGTAAINWVNFGVIPLAGGAGDPADAMFNTTNFPAINTTNDLPVARDLYALLTGRISGVSGAQFANPVTRQYQANFPYHARWHQDEMGFYGADSWRITPSLTLNYGLRWELGFGPKSNNNYWGYGGGEVGAFGLSGVGNLFKPGVLTGTATTYDLLNGRKIWDDDFDNLAPSVGVSWNPRFTSGFLGKLFGDGKTVIRSGGAVAYTREGQNHILSMIGANPGPFSLATLISDVDFSAGSLLLRNPVPSPSLFPSSYTFPMSARDFLFEGFGPNETARDIQLPRVYSWTFGIQRELTSNTVLEIRYDGNHAVGLWRQTDLNEINIFENGFLTEFRNAQNNLAICRANAAACVAAAGDPVGSTRRYFSNLGLPGQVSVPILTGAFTGSTTGSQTGAGFRSTTFISLLDTGQAGGLAFRMAAFSTPFCNLIGGGTPEYGAPCAGLSVPVLASAGFPLNFWLANPDSEFGGVFLLDNGAYSYYNGLIVEVRRRLANGFLYNFNYVWSKNLSDLYAVSSTSFRTKRSIRLASQQERGITAYDITHQFKANWIYELPFGPGRRWATGGGLVEKLAGGWAFHGIARVQSGRPFLLDSNRFCFNRYVASTTANDCGVQLIGLTRQQLEKMVTVRKTGDGRVFWLPPEFIGSDSRANPAFVRGCTTPGQFCQRVFLHGPWFNKFDFSIVKKTRVNEQVNVELRAEMLNVFNHPNFMVGSPDSNIINDIGEVAVDSTLWGRIRNTWQDVSTTNDLGSRIFQWVLRINF